MTDFKKSPVILKDYEDYVSLTPDERTAQRLQGLCEILLAKRAVPLAGDVQVFSAKKKRILKGYGRAQQIRKALKKRHPKLRA